MNGTGTGRAPEANWTAVGRGHGVQFYGSDQALVQLLTNFVGTALITGSAAVVVATPQHRDALAASLRSRGFDPDIAKAQGRYLVFDAAQMLSQFWSKGAIDAQLFEEVAEATLEEVLTHACDRRMALFGEMVSLLWASGKIDAAIELEERWNDLLDQYDFSLCCGYPMKLFTGSHDAAPFLRICAQHTHVFPAENPSPRPVRAIS